jgi:hypothetical protein
MSDNAAQLDASFTYLTKHVPNRSWIQSCRSRDDPNRIALQHQIVVTARSIMLCPMSSPKDWPAIMRLLCAELAPLQVDPSMFLAPLFQGLFERVDQFVDSMIQSRHQPWFKTLVESGIPSLHGFFSTGELIKQACFLYQQVIVSWPDDTVFDVVRPFFLSPSIFPFFESVIPEFCDLFTPFWKGQLVVRFELETTEIVKLVKLRSPAITREHRVLFQLLEKRFPALAPPFVFDIAVHFFQLFVRCRSDCKLSSQWMNKLFNYWRAEADGNDVRGALSNAFGGAIVSFFEVPSIFVLDHSIHYIVMRSEIILLVEVAKRIPSLAEEVGNMEAHLPHGEGLFTFNCFSKPPSGFRDLDPPLFFNESLFVPFERDFALDCDLYFGESLDNRHHAYEMREKIAQLAETARIFETCLLSSEVYHRIKRWGAILTSFQRYIYFPRVIEVLQWREGETISRLSLINSPNLQWEIGLSLLEIHIENALKADSEWWRNLGSLTNQWISNIQFTNKQGSPLDLLPRAVLSSAFMRCVVRLGRFDKENLVGKFAIVLEAAEILVNIAISQKMEPYELMKMAVSLSGSAEFARFYFIVSAFVFVKLPIEAIWSDKILRAWLVFEKTILSIIHEYPSLTALFFTISNSLGRPVPG